MKGLGIFSPYAATSGCILTAPCYDESCGTGSPRLNVDDKSLSLLGFEIRERTESNANPFDIQFDAGNQFNTFGSDGGFGNPSDAFGGYNNAVSGTGIADFTTYCSSPLRSLNSNLTALIWMECGDENGIIAVGTSTGDLLLVDATSVVQGDNARVISTTKVCNTPLRCLGYNPKTNMLGVAGIDGQISVCDLTNPADPKVMDTSYGKWRVGLVTGLSWNQRLGHILATSGSSLGPTGNSSPSDASGLVVWDLKARKPASSFRDPSGRMNPISIGWMPEQMTQLIVGYGDDKSPALQLWDLRNCSVPLKEVRGHTMGLTCLAISPHDPNLLLTSGRDDYTRLWSLDAVKGPFAPIASMQTGALSHHKRIQWHPQVPGLFVAQDTDDEISVHNAMGMVYSDSYMPAWTRRTCGVVSGFAGSLTSWNAGGAIKQYTLGSQLDDETSKIMDESLDVFCDLANTSNFEAICQQRILSANTDFDKMSWSVMGAIFKGEASALVNSLGYEIAPPKTEAVQQNVPEPEPEQKGAFQQFGDAPLDEADGEAFFNSLCNQDKAGDVDILSPRNAVDVPDADISAVSDTLSWGDDELCRKVVVGDYESAAQLCLDMGKHTEALFLAYTGGFELWMKVSADIVGKVGSPVLRTLQLLMQRDMKTVVENSPLDSWREILACLTSSTMHEFGKYQELCEILAGRLHASYLRGKKSHQLPASIVYMCSGNIPKVVDIWRQLETGKNSYQVLAHSVVRIAALSVSVAGGATNEYLGRSATMLAEAFVDCGDTDKALRCLSLPFVINCPQAAALRGRISGISVPSGSMQKPVAGAKAVAAPTYAQGVAPKFEAQGHGVPAQTVNRVGSSSGTAPGAVASAMYPGMPVPWPLPTATQQKSSSTRSTEDTNRRIIEASKSSHPLGERMNQGDLDYVSRVLGDLIARNDTSRAAQDNRKRIADLIAMLGNGEQSAEANGLILNMCRAIEAVDRVNANVILSTISTKLWNNTNKNWIMCLKRIVPK
ncbi:WD40/YVTN repeat domain containing superfamily protein [Babesia gibsoni]|uniref:WD40/YVTN repeat domain containing superfamily protein n=1 Tax=Babesia gibsoni TaxID=33632 RepID=A0AAD8LRX2_BABGI|nr:WD40/YVTN repeat domain containing superfamily protein [Babesia gibsoni]